MKALLIVSFGTSFPEALDRDIVPVENALAAAFPEYQPVRAFGSGMIIRKLKARDGVEIDTVSQALEKLCAQGVTELLVQPTFLIHGVEYDRLVEAVQAYRDRFLSLRLGRPLLSLTEDYIALAQGIAAEYPAEKGTLILMGHGTEHYANSAYPALESVLRNEGQTHVHVSAVEGYPDIDLLCRRMQAQSVTAATLAPLMLVAGDHATNDMASDEPDSWKSRLQEAGVEARCIIRGLGSYPFIQEMFVKHAMQAQ